MSPRKTPMEKLSHLVATYNEILAQLQARPEDRDLRHRLTSARGNVKFCCKSLKLTEPALAPAPPIPDSKRQMAPVKETIPSPEPDPRVAEEDAERQGTLQMLVDAMEDEAALPGPTADLPQPGTILHRIRRDFWGLLAAIEDTPDREALRSDLELVAAQAEQGLRLVDEMSEKKAG